MKYSIVIVAAGKGTRMGLAYNKLLVNIDENTSILDKTLSIFFNDKNCEKIVVSTSKDDIEFLKEKYKGSSYQFVLGGHTRQESVFNGLKEIDSEYVLVHDGARPWVTQKEIDQLTECLFENDAAILGIKVVQTIKEVIDGYIVKTIDREKVYLAQTPQAFNTKLLYKCHQKAIQVNFNATDDAQLVENFSDVKIRMVEGSPNNIKITTPSDLK